MQISFLTMKAWAWDHSQENAFHQIEEPAVLALYNPFSQNKDSLRCISLWTMDSVLSFFRNTVMTGKLLLMLQET